MTRICITGGPRTGKTTLAEKLQCNGPVNGHTGALLRHTDDLIASHDWSAASQAASEWLNDPGPWIIEGVAVSRALRKWHDQHPGEPPPVDKVIRLTVPHEPLSRGQTTMAKGEATVFAEIEEWLGWLQEHRFSPVVSEGIPRPDLRGRVRFEPDEDQ